MKYNLYELIIIFLVGIVITSIILAYVYFTIQEDRKFRLYCKEHGFDGVSEYGDISTKEVRCYKEVPDESGICHKTIYSGYITKKDIK